MEVGVEVWIKDYQGDQSWLEAIVHHKVEYSCTLCLSNTMFNKPEICTYFLQLLFVLHYTIIQFVGGH